MLIEKGADVNVVNENNDTALIFAAAKGNVSNEYIVLFTIVYCF